MNNEEMETTNTSSKVTAGTASAMVKRNSAIKEQIKWNQEFFLMFDNEKVLNMKRKMMESSYYFALFDQPDPTVNYVFSEEDGESFEIMVLNNKNFKFKSSYKENFSEWVMEIHSVMRLYIEYRVSKEQYYEFVWKVAKTSVDEWCIIKALAKTPQMLITCCREVLYVLDKRADDFKKLMRNTGNGGDKDNRQFTRLRANWIGDRRLEDYDFTRSFMEFLYELDKGTRDKVVDRVYDLVDLDTKLLTREVRRIGFTLDSPGREALKKRLEGIMDATMAEQGARQGSLRDRMNQENRRSRKPKKLKRSYQEME